MSQHIIVVDRRSDFPWKAPDRAVIAARDFVGEAARRLPGSARVINLCRDYSYLSLGYYSSLVAEARGQRVIPSVEVMLDLHWKRLLRIALPEIEVLLRKTLAEARDAAASFTFVVFFGLADDERLAPVARRVFELFRSPLLAIDIRRRETWTIEALRPLSLGDITPDQHGLFLAALDRYTRGGWRQRERAAAPARYSIAILHDPKEAMAPSNAKALEKFVRVGGQLGVEAELITRADYARLLAFDALLIRETTALDHHTYRFAKRAEAEGMPVIDDPRSILRCANKIFLAEMLRANGVATPRTLILDRRRLGQVERELGFPVVIKVPDGAFSRGVFKAVDAAALRAIAERVFKDSDLIIAQEFMRTAFDWRVGVLNGRPLFVCQYFMARDHWQIVKHNGGDRPPEEGGHVTLAVEDAPEAVVAMATRAAAHIGRGLYGVDLKETADGVFVVEINDNPNIDAGVEDAVLKDELYRAILDELVARLDRRVQTGRSRVAEVGSVPGAVRAGGRMSGRTIAGG